MRCLGIGLVACVLVVCVLAPRVADGFVGDTDGPNADQVMEENRVFEADVDQRVATLIDNRKLVGKLAACAAAAINSIFEAFLGLFGKGRLGLNSNAQRFRIGGGLIIEPVF